MRTDLQRAVCTPGRVRATRNGDQGGRRMLGSRRLAACSERERATSSRSNGAILSTDSEVRSRAEPASSGVGRRKRRVVKSGGVGEEEAGSGLFGFALRCGHGRGPRTDTHARADPVHGPEPLRGRRGRMRPLPAGRRGNRGGVWLRACRHQGGGSRATCRPGAWTLFPIPRLPAVRAEQQARPTAGSESVCRRGRPVRPSVRDGSPDPSTSIR
jgi:hypothetical protein